MNIENITRITNQDLATAALDGLSNTPKGLSPKWFYDAQGSALFEKITRAPEYYPTRTETAILEHHMSDIAAEVPDRAVLVELGSGASVKTRLLLDGLSDLEGYVPIDISRDFLLATTDALRADYAQLNITPVVADFMDDIALPDLGSQPVVGFFPGSTLGNLAPDAATALLARLLDWDQHEALILGVDLVKDADILEAAYDDAAGVTAAFNLNLLVRLNREADADFDTSRFRHVAVWNAAAQRVEMHLESLQEQQVQVAGHKIDFEAGETIHTENSHKFTADTLAALAADAGWRVAQTFTDPEDLFAVAILRPAA